MKSLCSIFAASIVAVLTVGAHDDQPPWTADDVSALAMRARVEASAPAIGLAIMRSPDDLIIAVDGVRLANDDAAVTPADRWHWGSVTKSMTATLVARLVEKGTVTWHDTVGEVLDHLVPNMHDAYRDVTIEHLLTHRSGMPANIPIERFREFAAVPKDSIADRLRWVQIALAQEPHGPMEETYLYSNNGYIVAGAMLEAITGQSWEALMRTEVFEPLGLASAGFGPPGGEDDQPRGHRPVDGVDTPVPAHADNPPALGPAGRVHMSLGDMVRYVHAHATKRADFLEPATFDRLHTPPFQGNYAHGWIAISADQRWHNGSNTMWYAEVMFNIATETAAAVVVNDGDIETVQPAVRACLRELMNR